MEIPEQTTVFLALATSATLKYAALRWVGGQNRKECVGKVSKVFVYPLKSGRELPGRLENVSLRKHGIYTNGVGDRHWLVTRNGDMWTMKQNARLTLIRTCIEDNALILDSDGMDSLRLPLDQVIEPERLVTVTVKLTPLPALDCGDRAAAWVCKVLQEEGLRLNYSAPTLAKRLSCKVHKDWPTQIRPFDEIAFQDFCHCMIMCESSMEVLNTRLPKPLTCLPFRPNVMVEGTKPFDEDNWREVYFGDTTKVRYVDKCTRCLITSIDPETGIKDKDDQPLKELKKFRCMEPYGPKPCMGIHTVVETEGEIKVGDPVYVIRK